MRWRPSTWLGLSVLSAALLLGWLRQDAHRPHDHGRTKPRDYRTTGLQDHGTTGLRDNQTTDYGPRAINLASRLPPLTNTPFSPSQLVHRDHAILLENALFDTEQPTALPIPAHLVAQDDPGSYIVQSRVPLDDAFRALLKAAGVSIVAYVPNNAYLVRVSAAGAQRLAERPQVQAVLSYQPYYKLKGPLLGLAMEQKAPPPECALSLLLFADAREAALADLKKLGAQILSEDRAPFGPMVKVKL